MTSGTLAIPPDGQRSAESPAAARPVCFATTDEGMRLPVVDVTNPAFDVEVDEAALPAFAAESLRTLERWSKIPRPVRRVLARRTLLLDDGGGASDAFVSGMTTYFLKLGPEQLCASLKVGGLDRNAAGAISSVAVRLRLRTVARLLADGLRPLLTAAPGRPLELLNIGGGTAIDSLNALILAWRAQRDLLREREVMISVLDVDDTGPAFGARALAALSADGAPLEGLRASLRHLTYDWRDPAVLGDALAGLDRTAVVAASSEGGLFEYASDGAIADNLAVLHAQTPEGFFIAGSLFRDERVSWVMKGMGGMSFVPRELAAIAALAEGWNVEPAPDQNPVYHVVTLSKRPAGS
jgi:hypothetical protein